MPSDRMRQVNMALRDYFASAISRLVEFPPGVVVSVIKVHTTTDLHNSTVFLSIVPDQHVGSSLKKIRKQTRELVGDVADRITFRMIPKFTFVVDDTERKAAHIEELLDSLLDPRLDKPEETE